MFVQSTLLGTLDRLAIRSVLRPSTGTIISFIGTLIFVALCIILFFGPVTRYFHGDFIESGFKTKQQMEYKISTGCDVKMAVSFFHKTTGKIANHTNIASLMKTEVKSYEGENLFSSEAVKCRENYFDGIEGDPKLGVEDCFIVEDNLRMKISYFEYWGEKYPNYFGFSFEKRCPDPFTCTYQSQFLNSTSELIIKFFDEYAYVVYFTTKSFDDYGRIQDILHTSHSSRWDVLETYHPMLYMYMHTQRSYMDDSIMPWYNNNTYQFPQWDGVNSAYLSHSSQLPQNGLGAYLTHYDYTQVVFRYYRKLDWLLGMLGGGILLLYLFFWIPCNYFNTVKQKIQASEALTLTESYEFVEKPNVHNLKKTSISCWFYLTNLFPYCFTSDHQKVAYSESMLDIANLIKKQKVTIRNIKKQLNLSSLKFSPRQLVFEDDEKTENENEKVPEEEVLDLHAESLKVIKSQKTPEAMQHHEVGLMANESKSADKKLQSLKSLQFFRKVKTNEQNLTCADLIRAFFKFFDVFGAKPNFSATPLNASLFGMTLTMIILILATLTFSLTLYNMSITRVYMDYEYDSPEEYHLDMKSFRDFRMAMCFHSYAFDQNYIVGPQRIANVQYFQYKRVGNKENIDYFDANWMKDDTSNFFQLPIGQELDLSYCMTIPKEVDLEIRGSPETNEESYFGIKISPFCEGTNFYCEKKKAQNEYNFLHMMSWLPTAFIFPENKYDPDTGQVKSKSILIRNNPSYDTDYYFNTSSTLYKDSFEETIFADTLKVEDSRNNWLIGSKPEPKAHVLTGDRSTLNVVSKTIPNQDNIQYTFSIKANGKVQRVVLNNYKVDFLFATVGGCFLFFYMVFCWIGKLFNMNKIQKELAKTLYTEQYSNQLCFYWIFAGCCCQNCQKMKKAQEKINNDLDLIGIARNVDASHQLSASLYPSLQEKNLALVYLKEVVVDEENLVVMEQKHNQIIIQDNKETLSNYFDFDLNSDISDMQSKKDDKIQSAANIKDKKRHLNEDLLGEPHKKFDFIESEETASPFQTFQKKSCLQRFLSKVDLFREPGSLTFEGKRSVQSVCGGITCLFMFIFIVLLTQYFITLFLSDEYSVSYQTSNDTGYSSEVDLKVGKNFKLLVSFFKQGNFTFQNVQSELNEVGISVIKSQYEKKNNELLRQNTTIALEPCPNNYLNGWIGNFNDAQYFENIERAYCVPDGTVLELSGNPFDDINKKFTLSIHTTNANTSKSQGVTEFLQMYIARFHMAVPVKDFSTQDIKYQIRTFTPYYSYNKNVQRISFNTTITKVKINYDTNLLYFTEMPSQETFDYDILPNAESAFGISGAPDRSLNFTFETHDYSREYTVKKTKVSELFGLIGGSILFVFFGLGVFVRSFNQYRMRYLIGLKLYQLRPSKVPTYKIMREFGEKKKTKTERLPTEILNTIQHQNSKSQPRIFLAWFLSLLGFIRSNYDFNKTLREISLIEKRASEDMNLFAFYKNMYMCETELKNAKLFGSKYQHVYPSRIFLKHVVKSSYQEVEVPQLLQYAIKENQLSDWEIQVIKQAKGKDITRMFDEKWLDKFHGINRDEESDNKSISSNSPFSESLGNLNQSNKEFMID